MKIKPLHKNFIKPERSTSGSAAYDIYMPEDGRYTGGDKEIVPLGFATEIPQGYAAFLLPRSGVGFKAGLEVNNTIGLIDSDFRDEWKAAIRTKTGEPIEWKAGDRLLQFMLLPISTFDFEVVDDLSETSRNGGFGSTGI